MITYEQACDIAASAFPGAVFSAAFEYPGGWVINVESHGWTEDQPVNEFGVSVIVHRSDGKWDYFDVGNPEFLDVLGIMKRIALPDKYVEMIRPKHNAG
ncbi:hypothetical protein [Bifidobacterium thermophilum]|uniref:hypothetical protein n=1 Tax=Bifidobacterium thermophilum TaxID=33905 RepID=UPI0030A307C6